MTALKVRKKPVIVEAWEITDEWFEPGFVAPETKSDRELIIYSKKYPSQKRDWSALNPVLVGAEAIEIHTLEGVMRAVKGDFIIRGVKGEVYPIRRDIFFETYDIIKENLDTTDHRPATLIVGRVDYK